MGTHSHYHLDVILLFQSFFILHKPKLLFNMNVITEQTAEKKMRRYISASLPVIEYIDKLYLSRDIVLDWWVRVAGCDVIHWYSKTISQFLRAAYWEKGRHPIKRGKIRIFTKMMVSIDLLFSFCIYIIYLEDRNSDFLILLKEKIMKCGRLYSALLLGNIPFVNFQDHNFLLFHIYLCNPNSPSWSVMVEEGFCMMSNSFALEKYVYLPFPEGDSMKFQEFCQVNLLPWNLNYSGHELSGTPLIWLGDKFLSK